MASIGDVKRRLSEDFIESLYNIFSPGVSDKILMAMSGERYTTLRVNTLKYDIRSLMDYLSVHGIKYERVLWYKDALILKNANERDIQNLEIYDKGYIYLQSLSSMIPPLSLRPKPGDKVLDVTAAPGSKTTQMAAQMQNKGTIIANELDPIRAERLKYNINKQGAEIVQVLQGRGEKLWELYPNYFDKVLLDAPCSGEGRFLINDKRTYSSWSIKEVDRLSKLQKKLFKSAAACLKIGGTMVYSTCTINTKENDEIVMWAQKELGMKLLDTRIDLKSTRPLVENAMNIEQYVLRVVPTKDMEGFFVSRFKKI